MPEGPRSRFDCQGPWLDLKAILRVRSGAFHLASLASLFMTQTNTTEQELRSTSDAASSQSRWRRSAPTTLTLAAALALPAITFAMPGSTWATTTALPAHPLVVHAVVVFAPLAIVLLIAAIVVRRWRVPLQWAAVASAVIAAVTSIIAKGSGDSLAAAIGLPEAHARWGNYVVTASLVFLVAAVAWVWSLNLGLPRLLSRALATLAVIAGVAMGSVTYAAGHSGAEAAWAGTFEQARIPITSGEQRLQPISLAEVARHASPEDCWSVVDGAVYDLTDFIARHPAGSAAVIEMCGLDATDDFMDEHAGQSEPLGWLEVFQIGIVQG